jgi:hypothetical protein
MSLLPSEPSLAVIEHLASRASGLWRMAWIEAWAGCVSGNPFNAQSREI